MTASAPAFSARCSLGFLVGGFQFRNYRMFVAGLRCRDFNWLAGRDRPAPVVIAFAPPTVTALAALVTSRLALALNLAAWFAARVPDLMRRLVAGRRCGPLNFVGVFLIFQFHEVSYIEEGVALKS